MWGAGVATYGRLCGGYVSRGRWIQFAHVSSNFPLPLFCTFASYIIEPKKVIQCAGMCQERPS